MRRRIGGVKYLNCRKEISVMYLSISKGEKTFFKKQGSGSKAYSEISYLSFPFPNLDILKNLLGCRLMGQKGCHESALQWGHILYVRFRTRWFASQDHFWCDFLACKEVHSINIISKEVETYKKYRIHVNGGLWIPSTKLKRCYCPFQFCSPLHCKDAYLLSTTLESPNLPLFTYCLLRA